MAVALQVSNTDLIKGAALEPQPQYHQICQVPSKREVSGSVGGPNKSNFAQNNYNEWLPVQNPISISGAPPTVINKSSAFTASTESLVDNVKTSLDYVADSLAKEALISSGALAPSISGLSVSKPTKAHPLKRLGSKGERTGELRCAIQTARKSTDRVSIRAVLRSRTFDVARGIVGSLARSNQISNGRREVVLGSKEAQNIRRNLERFQVRIDCLEDHLKRATTSSPMSNKNFLPKGRLNELVTQSSVDRELSRWKHIPQKFVQTWKRPYTIRIETDKYRNEICQLRSRSTSELLRQDGDRTYRKIFAILTFITRPSSIWLFVEEGVCDADLPLVKVPGANGRQHYFELQGRQATKRLECFADWKDDMIAKFMQYQWKFLAPSFCRSDGKTVPHQEFQPEAILPFTSWEEKENGGFGQVYKASIHRDHHDFDKLKVPDGVVAIKRLLSKHKDPLQKKEAFEKESAILRNMSKEQHTHDHLIMLLATFDQSDQYYLIFPWADADLEVYWEKIKPEPPTDDASMALWLVGQCQGMAEALSNIHRYETLSNTTMLNQLMHPRSSPRKSEHISGGVKLIGRHGDIKPKNILWFPDRSSNGGHGILKITDFGIAQFNAENMATKREKGVVPNSVTYRSPECDLSGEQVSAQCDVWALGCVYLVFVTWFFGGWNAVDAFAEKRKARDEYWHGFTTDSFFTIVRDGLGVPKAKVKDPVAQQIDKLQSHHACAEAFKKLLNLIQQQMLIIQKEPEMGEGHLVPANLTIPGKERARRNTSGNIARELGTIMVNCGEIPGYVARTTSLPDD